MTIEPELALPWMMGSLEDARQTIGRITEKVNTAYLDGRLNRDELNNGQMESLHEYLEGELQALEQPEKSHDTELSTDHLNPAENDQMDEDQDSGPSM